MKTIDIVLIVLFIVGLCFFGRCERANAESATITFTDAVDLEARVDSIGAVCHRVKDTLLSYELSPTYEEWRNSLRDTTWYQTYQDCKFDTVWSVFPYEKLICRQIEWVAVIHEPTPDKIYSSYGGCRVESATNGKALVVWREETK